MGERPLPDIADNRQPVSRQQMADLKGSKPFFAAATIGIIQGFRVEPGPAVDGQDGVARQERGRVSVVERDRVIAVAGALDDAPGGRTRNDVAVPEKARAPERKTELGVPATKADARADFGEFDETPKLERLLGDKGQESQSGLGGEHSRLLTAKVRLTSPWEKRARAVRGFQERHSRQVVDMAMRAQRRDRLVGDALLGDEVHRAFRRRREARVDNDGPGVAFDHVAVEDPARASVNR